MNTFKMRHSLTLGHTASLREEILKPSLRSDHFNNVFNAEGAKKLSEKDTLRIQQFDVAMIKVSESADNIREKKIR